VCVCLRAKRRYGFGVGGEYPMAAASAAERSQADASLRNRRGEQVVLTFSGQVRCRVCVCVRVCVRVCGVRQCDAAVWRVWCRPAAARVHSHRKRPCPATRCARARL
jgi:hypothetical protein